ncbi:MAG: hypothetical protein JXA66_03300 [Oligoflexia bacterium]|nr:hypothetical protein [Oligoflexia bacterium]
MSSFFIPVLSSVYFIPSVIGFLYIITGLFLEKKKILNNSFLYVLAILPVFTSSGIAFSLILSLMALYNAIRHSSRDFNITTLKYYFLAYAFILLTIPLFDGIRSELLISLFMFLFVFSSAEREVENTAVFLSNVTVMAILITKLTTQNAGPLFFLPYIILGSVALSLLRYIFDDKLASLLYILPVLLAGTVFSNKLYTLFFYLYFLIMLVESKRTAGEVNIVLWALGILPFTDSTLFYKSMETILSISDVGTMLKYSGLIVTSLFVLSAFKYCRLFRLRQEAAGPVSFLLLVAGVVILLMPVFIEKAFLINSSFPVVFAVPLIIVDSIYIKVFSKVHPGIVLGKITGIMNIAADFLLFWARRLIVLSIKKIRAFLRMTVVLVYLIPKLVYFYILTALICRIKKTAKRTRKNIVTVFTGAEEAMISVSSLESIIAVAALIAIVLFNILGD